MCRRAYLAAIVAAESGGDPGAIGENGSIGLMHLTEQELLDQGIASSLWFDPGTNILAGARVLGAGWATNGSLAAAIEEYFGSGCDLDGLCQ